MSRAARTLVSALLELLVVGRLLNDIQDGDRELRVRERERLRVWRAVTLRTTVRER